MENVVVISPPSAINGTTTETNVSDDDSESIILDLHVSDDSKDALQEVSEEDILNKFVVDEDEEMIGKKILDCIPSDTVNEDAEKESLDDNKSSEEILNDMHVQEDLEVIKKTGDDDKTGTTTLELELENNEEIGDDKTINCPLNENEENKTEADDDVDSKSNTNDDTDIEEEKTTLESNREIIDSTETNKKVDDENQENHEDGDLLQVMETSFVDEPEKDDASSSSDKEENGKEEVTEETIRKEDEDESTEEITRKEDEEETGDDSSKGGIENEDDKSNEEVKEGQNNNGSDQDQEDHEDVEGQNKEIDVDQNVDHDECPMDIEENNVGGVIILDHEDDCEEIIQIEPKKDLDEIIQSEPKKDLDEIIQNELKKDLDDDASVLKEEKDDENESKLKDFDSIILEITESDEKECESESVEEKNDKLELSTANDNIKKDEDDKSTKEEIGDNIELKKPTKRQLPNDFEAEEEQAKKIKLDQAVIKKTSETHEMKTLNSFKEYMKEKALKNMTRAQLEEFCLQKMCECLVDKSELADLRQKIRTLEQTVEQFRRESITIANQTRDLKIVHEKVTAALKVTKEQKSKPLVPVKITRSVGLQAVLDHQTRQNRLNGIIQNGKNTNCNNNNNNSLNNVNIVQNVTRNNINNNSSCNNVTSTVNNGALNNVRSPAKTQQSPMQNNRITNIQHRSPAQAIPKQTILNKQLAQKENRQGNSPIQPQVNGKKPPEASKAVIDLTDEDEKVSNSPNKAVRTNGQSPKSASLVTTPTGTKVMVIPSTVLTRPVMLKVNPNLVSKTTNITIPTSQVSLVTQSPTTQLATTQPVVTKLTPIRPATPQQSANAQRSPVQRFRQSTSPIPPPPPDQHHPGRMVPPKPHLNLTKSPCGTGIVLQWKMPYQLSMFDAIVSYQLYAYQVPKANQKTDGWGKIGDVKALELPMAVTLTQFAVGYRYYFAVRAVDSHQRVGLFSEPQTITL